MYLPGSCALPDFFHRKFIFIIPCHLRTVWRMFQDFQMAEVILSASLPIITDPSPPFRMTINVLYKDHIIKEYLACSWQLTADSFYLLTAFLTTGIDPSRLFRITINISLIIAPYRIPSFRAEVRMLYEKTGRRLCDTERRIYYNDDALPFPSLWRLAVRCHSDKHSLYKVIFL